jgi:hypothetical protein
MSGYLQGLTTLTVPLQNAFMDARACTHTQNNEEHYLLGNNAVQSSRSSPIFWRNVLPPSSWLNSKLSCILLGLLLALKMEAVQSSRTSAKCYQITCHHNSEDSLPYTHKHEILNYCVVQDKFLL